MFPQIQHIDDLLWALTDENGVRGEEWIVGERDGFTVVNYAVNFAHTFPDLISIDDPRDRLKAIVRREARGIKFCSATGKILARVYHKFFNVGEREETQPHQVNWSSDLRIMAKMDGSMIHPMILGGKMILCTKMGPTDVAIPAQEFAFGHDEIGYVNFMASMLENGFTPIFEWCSRKQRIVVDYPEDMLVLTAIRHMIKGYYVPYEDMVQMAQPFGIPVVEVFGSSIADIQAFLERTKGETEGEGYVIRFADGRMYKVKNEHYCRIHKAKELIAIEKNVWELVLSESMDDAMAFMEEADRNRLSAFTDALNHEIAKQAKQLETYVATAKEEILKAVGGDEKQAKKEYALGASQKLDSRLRPLSFQVWDGKNAFAMVRDFVLKNTGTSTKIESIRDLIPLNWYTF